MLVSDLLKVSNDYQHYIVDVNGKEYKIRSEKLEKEYKFWTVTYLIATNTHELYIKIKEAL